MAVCFNRAQYVSWFLYPFHKYKNTPFPCSGFRNVPSNSIVLYLLCQMVSYHELFSISTKFIRGMLLPCFAFLSFEVPANTFFGGYAFWNFCYSSFFRGVKEQISAIRHHQVQEEVVK